MSRAWTSDGCERGDLLAFGANNTSSFVFADATSKITGPYSLGIATNVSNAWYTFSQTFTANAEVFAQGRVRFPNFASFSSTPAMLLGLYNGTTLSNYVTIDSSLYHKAYRADGTLLGTASLPLAPNSTFTYLLQVHVLVNGATGAFTVKLDGVSLINLTNINTLGTGPATINAIKFLAALNGTGTSTFWDDCLCNINDASGAEDSYAADIRIVRTGPLAAGASTQLTPTSGANYQNMQAVPPSNSGTTYNYTSTPTSFDTYAPGSPSATIPSGATIAGVSVDAQIMTGNSPQTGKLHVNTHTTDYASSAINLPTSYGRIANRWRLNPNTGLAWTVTDALAAQMGVGLT